jgi:hypothetical protein
MNGAEYLKVGTARCAVRAAQSGATRTTSRTLSQFVPPAATRVGTSQRDVPTMRGGKH